MLDVLKIKRKTGNEKFTYAGKQQQNANISDFWKWHNSDLINNTLRGNLAEFIVAMSLGQKNEIQIGWAAWDLTYEGIKIEVKSSSYIQSWNQEKYSRITFGIGKRVAWNYESNTYDSVPKRHADVYVFALLSHQDQETINPLQLDQWVFYVLNTNIINEKLEEAKTVGISTLERIGAVKCGYNLLKKTLDNMSK